VQKASLSKFFVILFKIVLVWFQNYEKNLQFSNIKVKIFSKIVIGGLKRLFKAFVLAFISYV